MLKEMAGMRDILIHEFSGVDLDLPKLKDYYTNKSPGPDFLSPGLFCLVMLIMAYINL
jgi:hypothetical protein